MRECLICRRTCSWSALLCRPCTQDIQGSLHPRFEAPQTIDGLPIVAWANYEQSFAKLIKIIKAQPMGFLEQSLERLLASLSAHWREQILSLPCDCIVNLPSHPIRRVLQTDLSSLLAEQISQSTGLCHYPRSLEWNENPFQLFRNKSFQKARTRAERWQHSHRFRLNIPYRVPKSAKILLVDDVCATGASLLEGRRHFEAAGYQVVAAVVLARSEIKQQECLY